MRPRLRSLRDSREPVRSRGSTWSLIRSPAISTGECSLAPLPVDMQVDPEQNERPEHDRQQGREDQPPRPQVAEVVMRPGDRDADADVQQQQKAAAEEHLRFLSGRFGAKTL